MSSPLPPEIILPNGKTAWLNPYGNGGQGSYTTSRSYAMRMQRNFGRGISQSAARGHRISAVTGLTESQSRRQASLDLYQQTPWQRFKLSFEQRYGFSYSYWKKLMRDYLVPAGKQKVIRPEFVAQELQMGEYLVLYPGKTGKAWIEERLSEMLYATEEYQSGNKTPGMSYYATRDSVRPVEWWYYH